MFPETNTEKKVTKSKEVAKMIFRRRKSNYLDGPMKKFRNFESESSRDESTTIKTNPKKNIPM